MCRCFALFLIAAPAAAQDVGEAVRRLGDIETRQQQELRARQQELLDRQRTAPSRVAQPAAIPAVGENGSCTTITSVEFTGLNRFERDRFAAEIADATGPCVTAAAINGLLRAITNAYVAAGYVTSRALIGPQGRDHRTLNVTVVEGELEGIDAAPGGPGRAARAMAFPGLVGEMLDLRGIEQGLDQLNRLASNNVTIDIVPGSAAGASRVVVANRRRDDVVRASLSLDNGGQQATGRYQSTLSLEADNPLGLAEFWSFTYGRDAEYRRGRGTESFNGFSSIPYGPALLSVSGGLYRYDSILEGQAQRFASGGESWNLLVNVDRLVHRDADTKLTLTGTLRVTDTENSIRGIRLRVSSYRLVTLGASAQVQQRLGAGLLTAALGRGGACTGSAPKRPIPAPAGRSWSSRSSRARSPSSKGCGWPATTFPTARSWAGKP